MKVKEAVGDPAAPIPQEVVDNLEAVTVETLNTLTVMQLKKMSTLVDGESKKNVEMMEKCEKDRHQQLFNIGNLLHPSGESDTRLFCPLPCSSFLFDLYFISASKHIFVSTNFHFNETLIRQGLGFCCPPFIESFRLPSNILKHFTLPHSA